MSRRSHATRVALVSTNVSRMVRYFGGQVAGPAADAGRGPAPDGAAVPAGAHAHGQAAGAAAGGGGRRGHPGGGQGGPARRPPVRRRRHGAGAQ
eukprot:4514259-Pyramimonas_sp.AAC.2